MPRSTGRSHHIGTASPLRVLLFSPVEGRDPLSGDTSYTAALLADPPGGVHYTTYADALNSGTVRIRGQLRLRRSPIRDLPLDGLLQLIRLGLRSLRGCGLMFREPTWFVEIDHGEFDLIHSHLFAVRQVRRRLPVVSTYGYPLSELYAQREGWGARRLKVAELAELALARAGAVHVPWLHQVMPSLVAGYSQAARAYLIAHGSRAELTRLVSTGLPQSVVAPRPREGSSLLFIGRDFHRKGGDRAVAAYRELRARGHNVTLTVVTSADQAPPDRASDIAWVLDATRDRLVAELIPAHDVLIAPTRLDCGAPLAILEALRAGVPVVMTDLKWLDDRLWGAAVRRTGTSPEEIATEVQQVLRPDELARAGRAAAELFNATFTTTALGRELRALYDEVVALAS